MRAGRVGRGGEECDIECFFVQFTLLMKLAKVSFVL